MIVETALMAILFQQMHHYGVHLKQQPSVLAANHPIFWGVFSPVCVYVCVCVHSQSHLPENDNCPTFVIKIHS